MFCIAEALEMNYFAFAEEADRVGDVAVIAKSQDIIIGQPCFLFCRKIFGKVGNGITRGLDIRSGERLAACGCGINSRGVVNKIGGKSAVLNLLCGKVAR